MKLRPEQLIPHLQKSTAPIYWVAGDEPLLMQETCKVIREHMHHTGFTERKLFVAETGFDWAILEEESRTYSLWNSKRLLELRLHTKPTASAAKMLQKLAEDTPPDIVLLIVSPKLDTSVQNTLWYKAIETRGVVIPIWPIDATQMPRWITERLRGLGLEATPHGVQILIDCAEGNLLAAAQEIEKLHLLYGAGKLDDDNIINAVTDSARFDVFKLTDSILQGEGKRLAKILAGLKAEGVEPTLILWAIARELRQLLVIAYQLSKGQAIHTILDELRIWDKRKSFYKNSSQRHSLSGWQTLLQHASKIDAIIKGSGCGNLWDELLQLSLHAAGMKLSH